MRSKLLHTPKTVEANPDFPKLERELLNYWYKSGVVNDYLTKNKSSKKCFSFLDGPITANNPMGVHHAWGRTYKDLWQRFYNMLGYKQRFQSGFDAQGLWVEVEVEKELGFKTKKDIEKYGVAKFVQKCKDRVIKYSKIQTDQSIRLGYFMDWDHSYFTMSDENNYMIWHFIKVCHENGWLYKGKDSCPWCPRCETAISQHEMLTEDYKEVTHESIYFVLPIVGKKREFLLVWTTTPWTIPANIAVAVDAKLDYSLVEGTTGDKYWIAKEAVDRVFGKEYKNIIKTVKGRAIVGSKYTAPFDHLPAVKKISVHSKFHTVIATDPMILPVTTDEGTGFVHTAVSAGTEDFRLGQKLGLPMVPVIADNADYLGGLGFLTGKNAKKNPRLILDYLEAEDKKDGVDWVFNIHKYKHRYPGCWRCKTELVWKVTDEWYIAMDKGSPSLRDKMINVAKKITWHPSFGLDRELDWLNNMHDWLISKKNRYWGLCLPIWECTSCGTFEVIGSKEELKKRAVDGWKEFSGKSPHKPYIDRIKIQCKTCGVPISRVEPVGNPWLDAGIVPFSTISKDNKGKPFYKTDKAQWKNWFPADFITESFPGQFKNWFYSMIAMSSVLENTNPFKTVLGFATLLGEDGRPMHKSWGNAIEFNEGADNIGVDVMRWMYARHDPGQNLLFGEKTANLVRRQFHLMLWNCYRFIVNNLDSDNTTKPSKKRSDHILDRWILSRLYSLIDQVTEELKSYRPHKASEQIEYFVQDFSTWYIRRSRDRVSPFSTDQSIKHAFYNTGLQVLTTLSQILAPFTPYLADLMFKNITGERSVHLTSWPKSNGDMINKKLEHEMISIREIVELGHASRKAAGVKVRQPLSELKVEGGQAKLSLDHIQLIKDELNVKNVIMKYGKDELRVSLDTKLTKDLQLEGEAREFIRTIQNERKKLGLSVKDKIRIMSPTIPSGYEKEITTRTLANVLVKGSKFKIEKI